MRKQERGKREQKEQNIKCHCEERNDEAIQK